MSFLHFRLLMWKNLHLKLHHWIITLLEFILPIGCVLLLLKLMEPGERASVEVKESPEEWNFTESLSGLPVEICYSPSSPLVTDFMNVMKKIKNVNVTSLSDEKELERYVQNSTRNDLVGVHFRELVSETSGIKFSYVLKKIIGATPYDDYFTKTQLLLNEIFIQSVKPAKKLVWDEVYFQKAPYIEQNSKKEILFMFFIVCVVIWMFSISLMGDILEEKNSGIKELMKIAGVKESTIWLTWFFYGLIGILISLTISTVLLEMYPLNDKGLHIVNYVPFVVLCPFWILYCVANISFCFMFSTIFQSQAVNSIIFSLYMIVIGSSYKFATKFVPPFILCLFPHLSFWLCLGEVDAIENNGIEFNWSTFSNTQNKSKPLPFGLLYIFCTLIVDTLLYLFLAFYIININPGKFGTRKSPFFLCQGIFSKNKDNEDLSMSSPKSEMNPKYFEPPPSNLTPAIRIVDLHKRFRSLHAVRGVNLVTFKGEITALLGHNGAGKTTTLSILTGLIPPSSGNVYYSGMNAFKNMNKFRSLIGLCPQDNRTFPYLSVMNHLLFFGQLKGASKKEAQEEAEEYLNMVGMKSKRNSSVSKLSGGMKRKLCLCIAMMGKAEVLILDEPSAGMDAESRRSLWDLLLRLRKGRSMILTTHYMEEADALGDRIAIMNHGIIVCHGTSMFLKKAYETGYELTITKSSDNSTAITQVIQGALPTASVISESGEEVVYKLPLTETHRFPALFRSLESTMMRLGVQSIGVTATTMEQVFLIAGGSTAYDPKSPKTIVNDADYNRRTGLGLLLQQLLAILRKKFLFSTRDFMSLLTRLIVPTLLACFMLYAVSSPRKSLDTPVELTLSTASGNAIILYEDAKNLSLNLEVQLKEYVTEKNAVFIKSNGSGLDKALFSLAAEQFDKLKNFVSGIEVNSTVTRLMYRDDYCKPIAIDLYSNVLIRTRTNSNQSSIEATYQPIPNLSPNSTGQGCRGPEETQEEYFAWIYSLGSFTIDWLTYFAHFVSMERADGFYHIQMMSRMPTFIYWFGTLVFDFMFFSIAMIIRIALFKLIGSMNIIGFHEAFYIYLLITALFGISGLLFIYLMSSLINFKDHSARIFIIFNVLCFVIAIMEQNIPPENLKKAPPMFEVIQVLMYTVPFLTYYKLLNCLILLFSMNFRCTYCLESYRKVCEAEIAPMKLAYFEYKSEINRLGMLSPLLQISGQIVAYSLILFLINTGILGHLFNLLKKTILGTKSTKGDTADSDVQRERNQVQKYRNQKSSSQKLQNISLLVDGLRKNYISWFRNFTAVSDASFVVDRGTCFGLLGVNGAGKSTTFKMLTAEILPTAGDAQIDGYKLSKNKSEYLKLAGYCSQTNCFIEQLTGSEMLTIIASMRGVRGEDRKELVDKWISIISLEEYKNRRCGTYSGGNKRKLCSVMSLIGDPRVVFLDEPTSGVDPVARRNLYDVMAQSRSSGQTVVLTSHSMEECETLCDRLTIMVSGVMKCIGSVQHLKKRYAQGFSAMVKIFDTPEAQGKISELKETILQVFNPSRITLKDERPGLLYYQITDTSLPWSALFEMMERVKSQFQDVVQDYVITDTSLEEVFISFAKESMKETKKV